MHDFYYGPIFLIILTGFPAAKTFLGILFVTTLPAPTTLPSPITTPGYTITFAPNQHPFSRITSATFEP